MSPRRRAVQVLLILATALVALVAVALILLQSPWGREYVRDLAERRAEAALDADVTIGRLGGSLLFGATIDDFAIARNGERLVVIDRVSVDYDVFDLMAGRLDLQQVELVQPVIQADAIRMFTRLGGRGDGQGSQRTFSIGEIVIRNARMIIGEQPAEVGGFRVPDVIRDLDASVALRIGPDGTRVAVDRLSFTGEAPELTLQSMTGTIVIHDGDLALEDISVQLGESSFEFGGTIENFGKLGASS